MHTLGAQYVIGLYMKNKAWNRKSLSSTSGANVEAVTPKQFTQTAVATVSSALPTGEDKIMKMFIERGHH